MLMQKDIALSPRLEIENFSESDSNIDMPEAID